MTFTFGVCAQLLRVFGQHSREKYTHINTFMYLTVSLVGAEMEIKRNKSVFAFWWSSQQVLKPFVPES